MPKFVNANTNYNVKLGNVTVALVIAMVGHCDDQIFINYNIIGSANNHN